MEQLHSKYYFSPIMDDVREGVSGPVLPWLKHWPWCSLVPGEQSCMCCGSTILKQAKFKPPET